MLLAGIVLAVPATIVCLFNLKGVPVVTVFGVRVLSTIGVAWCLSLLPVARRFGGVPTWIAFLSVTALAPLAVESLVFHVRSEIAWLALGLAVVVSHGKPGARALSLSLAVVACICDATALIWPLGCLLGALTDRRLRVEAAAMLLLSLLAVVVMMGLGQPTTPVERLLVQVHGLHRDLTLLLPVLVLGSFGWMTSGVARDDLSRLKGTAGVAMVALVLILLGVPLSVRVCVLPFWWWMPAGWAELASLKNGKHPVRLPAATQETRETPNSREAPGRANSKQHLCYAERSIPRAVGWLGTVLLLALVWPGLRQWLDGALLVLFLP